MSLPTQIPWHDPLDPSPKTFHANNWYVYEHGNPSNNYMTISDINVTIMPIENQDACRMTCQYRVSANKKIDTSVGPGFSHPAAPILKIFFRDRYGGTLYQWEFRVGPFCQNYIAEFKEAKVSPNIFWGVARGDHIVTDLDIRGVVWLDC